MKETILVSIPFSAGQRLKDILQQRQSTYQLVGSRFLSLFQQGKDIKMKKSILINTLSDLQVSIPFSAGQRLKA